MYIQRIRQRIPKKSSQLGRPAIRSFPICNCFSVKTFLNNFEYSLVDHRSPYSTQHQQKWRFSEPTHPVLLLT